MPESKLKMRHPRAASAKSYKARSAMFRDVVMLFYATTERLRALRRLIASSVDLNAADYSIVAALYRLNHEPGVRVREVADYLHLSPENVTTAVQRLVKAKWIVKADHPDDARSVTLRLNTEARQRIDQLTYELREINELWFSQMTTAEVKSLIRYLENVLDGFDLAYDKAKEKLRTKPKRWKSG
jgi:DNA-binding MarR family transcriptional regulator